jgi:homoserine kinase
MAAMALQGREIMAEEVIGLVGEIEGHRDNAAGSMLGGLVICSPGEKAARLQVPRELMAVLFIPEAGLSTKESRGVLPEMVSLADAIFNAGRCALLVQALAVGEFEQLGAAMEDCWHQAARARLVPFTLDLMQAAKEGGAAGVCLAGSGPSVLALTAQGAGEIAENMEDVARKAGVAGRATTLGINNLGASLVVVR